MHSSNLLPLALRPWLRAGARERRALQERDRQPAAIGSRDLLVHLPFICCHGCVQEREDEDPFKSMTDSQQRQELVKELHLLKTDLFMRMVEDGMMPLRPGVKRLVGESTTFLQPLSLLPLLAIVLLALRLGLSSVVGRFAVHTLCAWRPRDYKAQPATSAFSFYGTIPSSMIQSNQWYLAIPGHQCGRH